MNVVITMAGIGKRFQDVGYNCPKYMIKAKGKTMFEWSMLSLKNFNHIENIKYIFVTRKEDNNQDFIQKYCSENGICNYNIVELDKLTDGQATSAMHAKKFWNEDDELIIYNIDTYVEPDALKYEDIKGDGFIPCFNAEGSQWSFVKLDENGDATEVREKERISDNCTIGLYYFKSCKLYEQVYYDYYKEEKNIEKNEKYIAPLYNHMIKNGMKVNICVIPSEKVHELGTPKSLQEFEKSNI